jgi:hypothetical protein
MIKNLHKYLTALVNLAFCQFKSLSINTLSIQGNAMKKQRLTESEIMRKYSNIVAEAEVIPGDDQRNANRFNYQQGQMQQGGKDSTDRTIDLYPEEADAEVKKVATQISSAIAKATGKPPMKNGFYRYETQLSKDPSYDLLVARFADTGLDAGQIKSLTDQLTAQGYVIINKNDFGFDMSQVDRNGRSALQKRKPLEIPAAGSVQRPPMKDPRAWRPYASQAPQDSRAWRPYADQLPQDL